MKRLTAFILVLACAGLMLASCIIGTGSTSTLNGVALSEFSIVYSDEDADYSARAAEYIRDEISRRTGLDLPILEDSEGEVEYEIVVGETDRAISERLDADTEGVQFAILAEDGKIALEGDYFVIAAAAYFFINTYIPSNNFDAEIPTEAVVHDPITLEAKNFILLIGDGMGVNQSTLYEVLEDESGYSDGESEFYGYYLPTMGYARTDSLSGTTDSAAAGTALSCGTKTLNGCVGVDKDHVELQSITELAASLGKATAVMSTEASTGATPSAFSAHTDSRSNSDDILKDQDKMTDNFGTIINCNFNYYTRGGVKILEDNIDWTLDDLTKNEKGFFLMYEEAHIDKHCHSNDIDRAYLALIRFNQAIGRFMEYAFYNPDTLVIITADHETGGLHQGDDGEYAFSTEDHTSADVPVFAYGEGSEYFDGKTVENTDIPKWIASLMGVSGFAKSND